MKSTRRDFLKQSGVACGSVAMLSPVIFAGEGLSGKRLKSFGFQSWTIRQQLNADPAGTCKKMAGLGYQEIEMCSPLGYVNSGFAPLNKFSGTELRMIIEDNGLKCTSAHFNLGELRESLDDRIHWAHQMGMKQMVLSSFWLSKEEQTLANYRKSAAELNRLAEKTKAAGLQMGFHNHHMEFEKRDGQLIYDALLEAFDPDLVKMQFQVAVVNLGYQAADYFRKYPGRFISAHLQDYAKAQDRQAPIGQGDIDWKDFFEAAKTGGVKNFYVEMSPDTFKPSAEFLATL
jgi:sugar phosphate isomerase/epimerase